MPFIHISLGIQLNLEEKHQLAEQIGNAITIIPGKSYEKTMIRIDSGCDMFRAGKKARVAFVDTRLYQESKFVDKQLFVRKVYELLQKEYGLGKTDVYFNIFELNEWGSRGDYR